MGGTAAQGVKLPCDATYCLVAWPGKRYRAFLERDRSVHQQNFFGSLTTGQENSNGLMYMRNRYYNPLTGAFTQTDPIGLAGGVNTYGYAEGNPATYSDPFGLKVCAKTPGLKQAISDAVQMTITWKDDCVASAQAVEGSESYGELQQQFSDMVAARNTWTVRWGPRNSGSRHTPNRRPNRSHYQVRIDPADIGKQYDTLGRGYCGTHYGPVGNWTLESLIVHELIGHGGGGRRRSLHVSSVATNSHRLGEQVLRSDSCA